MNSLINCIMLSKVVIGDDPQYFHVMIVETFRAALVRNPALKFLRVQRISPKNSHGLLPESPRTPGFINKNSFFCCFPFLRLQM